MKWEERLVEEKKQNPKNMPKKLAPGGLVAEIRSTNNRIYFYAPVNTKSVLAFNEELVKVRNILVQHASLCGTTPAPIYIHINSGGGTVYDGLSAMDAISRCDIQTISVVDGRAASAATFLSLAADKKLITPHSAMLIHQLSSGLWGKYEESKDYMKNIDRLMMVIKEIYKKRTKIGKKMLKEILKHDLYFGAEKCIKYGLADEILR